MAARPLVPGMAASITMTCGIEAGGQRDRFVAVAGLAHHGQIGIVLEQAAEPAPHQRVVVGEQHRDPAGGRAVLRRRLSQRHHERHQGSSARAAATSSPSRPRAPRARASPPAPARAGTRPAGSPEPVILDLEVQRAVPEC